MPPFISFSSGDDKVGTKSSPNITGMARTGSGSAPEGGSLAANSSFPEGNLHETSSHRVGCLFIMLCFFCVYPYLRTHCVGFQILKLLVLSSCSVHWLKRIIMIYPKVKRPFSFGLHSSPYSWVLHREILVSSFYNLSVWRKVAMSTVENRFACLMCCVLLICKQS